jgi:LPXTG-site transpeptidase (sortase) family protein
MKTPHFEPDILTNNKTRLSIPLLGLILFIGLLLISASTSSAQGQVLPGNRVDLSVNGTEVYYSQQLTDTVTATPTVTLTPTPTLISTNTATATESPTPTETSSPGNTPTSTPTPTNSPTTTVTPSTTPTITGTPPTTTPTSTATVNPGATISVSVSPSSASVNETLTFTIKVGNTSDLTTVDNIIVDSFPTFIDVISVTYSGTVTKGTHSFIATIGEVDPDEIVTITALVRVNSTLSRTEYLSNVVTLTYDQRGSKNASVTYRVVYTSLPGTGDLPLNWRQDGSKSFSSLPGILLIVFGGTLLGLVRWTKARIHKDRLWMTVSGSLLILAGCIVMASSLGLFNQLGGEPLEQVNQANEGNVVEVQPAEPSATSLVWQPASAFSTPDSVVPIVTLPDYPIPTPVLTITPKPGEAHPDTSAIVRIIIPALLLDTEVKYVPYDGYTWLINGLRQEIAWMGNTSWPGLGSNTGLAGHVTVAGMGDGPFRHLDELPMGEVIILYTEQNIYTYQASERKITDDGDMSVINPTDTSQISLITCIDWDDATKTYLNRLVVVADLIRTEPITMGLSR